MKNLKNTLFLLLFCMSAAYAQISGCTDVLSINYNPNATVNNGSCEYKNFNIKTEYSIKISDSIKETSGLIAFDNLLWTHNDDHDITLYGLDARGKIQKKTTLEKVENNDWEEISQDSTYLYLGDFGNNYSGNRRDLQILRIDKKSFLHGNPIVENISFHYSDQTDFSKQKGNNTNFDCEAFVATKDSLYLFTKHWGDAKTSIYSLPNQAGNHIARQKETLDVKGLITGATLLESKKLLVLCGYSKKGKPFLYLFYDYKNNDFLSGNKRKIALKLPFHQIEGIATEDGLHYYLTNEALVRKPILNIQQQIHRIDLSSILNSYLNQ